MPAGPRISFLIIFIAMGVMLIGAYYLLGISLKNYFINVGEHFNAFIKQSISFFKGMF